MSATEKLDRMLLVISKLEAIEYERQLILTVREREGWKAINPGTATALRGWKTRRQNQVKRAA